MMGAYVVKEMEKQYDTGDVNFRTIVPHLYGKRQQANLARVGLNNLLLDEELGSIMEPVLFRGGQFKDHLASVLRDRRRVEKDTRDYLRDTYGTIDLEVNTGSRIKSEAPSYYFFPAVASELFQRAQDEEILVEAFGLDPLQGMEEVMAPVDLAHRRVCLPGYHTFSSVDRREPLGNEYHVPSLKPEPVPHTGDLPENSVYVMLSGTQAEVNDLLDHARRLREQGRHVIISQQAAEADLEDFPQALPEVITNPHVTDVYGRAGWGVVTDVLHAPRTRLHTLPYRVEPDPDDPEIYFNSRTLREVDLSIARALLLDEYSGDLDGPKKVAELILSDLT